ncbi:hypothetical protein H351_31005 (plasmid) [Rhodococcus erythropolis R138]|nr:hypothetical protein H351_31005 [Rhodococcus erythropolis R138]
MITRSIRVMPCAAKKNRALFMKSMAVAAVSLFLASVYARRVLPSIAECGMQVGVADAGLLVLRFPAL